MKKKKTKKKKKESNVVAKASISGVREAQCLQSGSELDEGGGKRRDRERGSGSKREKRERERRADNSMNQSGVASPSRFLVTSSKVSSVSTITFVFDWCCECWSFFSEVAVTRQQRARSNRAKLSCLVIFFKEQEECGDESRHLFLFQSF